MIIKWIHIWVKNHNERSSMLPQQFKESYSRFLQVSVLFIRVLDEKSNWFVADAKSVGIASADRNKKSKPSR